MRRMNWSGVVVVLTGLATAAGAGCGTLPPDCPYLARCALPDGGNGGGGEGGSTPLGCVPSKSGEAVNDGCGVFVAASGDDAAAGTKDAPVKTIQQAVTLAQHEGATRRVYACAQTFEGAIELPGGVALFGGLDCSNGWGWIGETTKTAISATEGEIPLVMRGGDGAVRVEDVYVTARAIDPSNEAARGRSSIAALAESAAVEMARCTLEAGNAADGSDGEPYEEPALAGEQGNPGREACSAEAILGGLVKRNECGTPDDQSDDSTGGRGGIGELDSGGDGNNGTPADAVNGGSGQNTAACTTGGAGTEGAAGDPGPSATGLGSLSSAGYGGVSGRPGTPGTTAQGGGGGGGAKGGSAANQCAPDSAGGASGGSGGPGGCGGKGGKPGGPGGASIALVSLDASLTFDDVSLKTSRGGRGGNGGPGQEGGLGGLGGLGGTAPEGTVDLKAGCAGGPGGKGGNGGIGGGGIGGHSLGIAFHGTPPPASGLTITTGEPGPGGNGDGDSAAAGIKADTQEFAQ
ncbi:PGRS family protein [Sorangium sp. So ce1000]|uniref:PGRS family protein n=1 Tax=Sorangium sp. So ce1000 TaxID=3133325 RepID=UPI003F6091EC